MADAQSDRSRYVLGVAGEREPVVFDGRMMWGSGALLRPLYDTADADRESWSARWEIASDGRLMLVAFDTVLWDYDHVPPISGWLGFTHTHGERRRSLSGLPGVVALPASDGVVHWRTPWITATFDEGRGLVSLSPTWWQWWKDHPTTRVDVTVPSWSPRGVSPWRSDLPASVVLADVALVDELRWARLLATSNLYVDVPDEQVADPGWVSLTSSSCHAYSPDGEEVPMYVSGCHLQVRDGDHRVPLASVPVFRKFQRPGRIDELFPSADGPVFASWFSGEVRLAEAAVSASGDPLPWWFAETETVLTIEHGVVVHKEVQTRQPSDQAIVEDDGRERAHIDGGVGGGEDVQSDLTRAVATRRIHPVPRTMVAAATKARASGDWRAACDEADVLVLFTIDDVRGKFGADVADRLAEDVNSLAPDLLRWHLASDPLASTTVLARYAPTAGEEPCLWFQPPEYRGVYGALGFGQVPADRPLRSVEGERYLWDPTHAASLFAAYGGVDGPLRSFDSAGDRRAVEAGERVEAIGVESSQRPVPPAALPVEVLLLERGLMAVDDLHPLVSEALFPDRRTDGPAGALPRDVAKPGPVSVECQGVVHVLEHRDNKLSCSHPDDDIEREMMLAALGAPISGCAGALRAWRSGRTRDLPEALATLRSRVFVAARKGKTTTVLELLDEGLDPTVRDARGRTLLHVLSEMDHALVLPRLLDLGLDVDAADARRRTPLWQAVHDEAVESLVAALLAAGADPRRSAADGTSALSLAVEDPDSGFAALFEAHSAG